MVKIGAEYTEDIPKIKLGVRFWTTLYVFGSANCSVSFG